MSNSEKTQALIKQLSEEWSKMSDEEFAEMIRNTPKGDIYYMMNPDDPPPYTDQPEPAKETPE